MTEPTPDSPVPFGYKICWLGVRSMNGAAVATALGVEQATPATWAQGVAAAYGGGMFVTPPIDGWTLVVGDAVAPDVEHADGRWRATLIELSRQFEVAQLFATHRVIDMHAWACARNGVLERAYCYSGESGEIRYDEGEQTAAERELGFDFGDPNSPEAEHEAYWERDDLFPDEASVMALADRWSISPVELTASSAPPGLGLLVGKRAPRPASTPSRKPWWRFW